MLIKYKHHDKVMVVQSDLKGKHKEHCLCYMGCLRFLPGSQYNCEIAEKIFQLNVEQGVTTPVWECAFFESSNSETNRRLSKGE